jgi:hypothetical protein
MKDRLYALVLALCLVVVLDAAVNMSPLGARSVSGRPVVPQRATLEVSPAGLEYGPDAYVWGDGESPFADPANDPVTNIYWEMQGGAYSYESGCTDDGIDPVGMILLSSETTAQEAFDRVEGALSDAGLGSGEGPATDRQHYSDYGVCVNGEMTQGSNPGYALLPPNTVSRWHARCNFLSGQFAYQQSQTYWSSCTPHWDQETGHENCDKIAGIFGGHYVPPAHSYEEFINVSGFTTAREWLFDQLDDDEEIYVGTESSYGNTRPQTQCNDVDTAGDGVVQLWLNGTRTI